MRIYTKMGDIRTYRGELCKALTIYLDTEMTGDPEQDTVNCAVEFDPKHFLNGDPETFLNLVIPMITQLAYNAYGEPARFEHQTPIESIKETNFDPACLNGVRGYKLKDT